MQPTSLPCRFGTWLIVLSVCAVLFAQAPPSIQIFMPDGSLPPREIRFKLRTDDGRVDEFFTDSRGRFLFTRKEGLNPNAGYTIIVESDGTSYDTTTVSFKYYQSTVYYVPIFLKPLIKEPKSPGGVVDFSTLAVQSPKREKGMPWSEKPYTDWSEKEALRVMNDSPWGQTQTVTDTSDSFGTARRQTRTADTPEANFRIRFLSAKPMRQAISRWMELQQKGKVSEQLAMQLAAFATADFPDYIVITVTCDASNLSASLQEANALLHKLTTADLQNTTYLLAKGGTRLFLQEYQTPRKDGLGARFVFPRVVNGEPFLSAESGEVRFYSELGNALKIAGRPVHLNMRFNLKHMVFGGKLEY